MSCDKTLKDFTPEELKEISDGMWRTWDAIGMDVLQCAADAKGKNRDRITIPRVEVVETVLDADYMLMYGGDGKEWKELYERWRQVNYEQMKKLARTVFTYSRYGM